MLMAKTSVGNTEKKPRASTFKGCNPAVAVPPAE
jgi:hypothetical protein